MKFHKTLQSEYFLDKILTNVLNSYFQPYINYNSSYYNFRCNICGDSKKSKIKKRAYILKDKWPWMFYCHNCFNKINVEKWLKEYFPIYYREYIKEILKDKKIIKKENENKQIKQQLNKTNETYLKQKNKKIIQEEKNNVKYFIPILKGNNKIFDLAISFCKERKIPEKIWKTWFVATDGLYKNRIIIPFYNNKSIYYWQGRALYSWMVPKYLSRKEYNRELNCIYNYYNINKSSPVIIFEGMLDSIFVENSIGMTGLKKDNKKIDFKYKYWLLDNDKAGKSKSIELINKGEFVFKWKPFLKDLGLSNIYKDINDVVIKTNKKYFKFKELEPYFTNSIFDKIYFV